MADRPAPRDSTAYIPGIGAASNDGNGGYVELWADPITHRLLVGSSVSANALGTIITAQVKITASAQQGPTNTLTNGVIVSALSTNSGHVFIGVDNTVDTTVDGTGSGYILQAGASTSFAVSNTSSLWFIGTLNDVISLAGS